jgi:hypothetical protein
MARIWKRKIKPLVMVNIIENKAKIEAAITDVDVDAGPQGYCQVKAKLQKSEEVEDFPNLAKADEGTIITVNLRPTQLTANNLEKGKQFSATVRKVFGQQYFMEEDSGSQESS